MTARNWSAFSPPSLSGAIRMETRSPSLCQSTFYSAFTSGSVAAAQDVSFDFRADDAELKNSMPDRIRPSLGPPECPYPIPT